MNYSKHDYLKERFINVIIDDMEMNYKRSRSPIMINEDFSGTMVIEFYKTILSIIVY